MSEFHTVGPPPLTESQKACKHERINFVTGRCADCDATDSQLWELSILNARASVERMGREVWFYPDRKVKSVTVDA